MNLLCLDPSIVSTGYAIYHVPPPALAPPVLLDSGSVQTRKAEPGDVARIRYLIQAVRLLTMPHEIREVVIEIPGAFSYKKTAGGKGLNQDALRKLNMVIGAFIGMTAGWPTHLVPVQTWKGRRAKVWDRLAAPEAATSDESDAIALGRWWLTMGRQIMEKTRAHTR